MAGSWACNGSVRHGSSVLCRTSRKSVETRQSKLYTTASLAARVWSPAAQCSSKAYSVNVEIAFT